MRDEYTDAVLQGIIREGCCDQVTSGLRPKGSERASHERIWEENILGSGNSWSETIHVGLCLVGLRNYKEACVAWAE